MNTFFENIEPYLDNELSQRDKIAFEMALQQDENLQTALAEEKTVRATLYLMMTEKFKAQINNLDEKAAHNINTTNDKQVKIVTLPATNRWKNWAIAATFLGLVLTGFMYFYNQKVDTLTLAVENTFDYPTPQYQSSIDNDIAQNTFYDLIKNKDYQKAIVNYSTLPEDVKKRSINCFFYAFCQLKNKQFKDAISSFQTIKDLTIELKEPVEWYVIVAQLGDNQDVKGELERITKNVNHSFYKKALKLKSNLE